MDPQAAQPNAVNQALPSPRQQVDFSAPAHSPELSANSEVASILDLQLHRMYIALQELDTQTHCMEQMEIE